MQCQWVAKYAGALCGFLLVGSACAQAERVATRSSDYRDPEKQASAAQLRVVNGGFEDLRPDLKPFGWILLQHTGDLAYKFEHDVETFAGGKRSFRVVRFAQQAYATIKQVITLPPGHGYRKLELTAMMKSKATDGKGWRLIASINAGPVQFVRQYMSEPLLGDHEWQRVKLEIPIEHSDTDISVGVTLLGGGAGWVDDVELKQIE